MKKGLVAFFLLFSILPVLGSTPNTAPKTTLRRPWVFFDLGDTVINTKDKKHFTFMEGAHQYLRDLKENGYNIGLISNIPEKFGANYQEKLATLKKFIASRWAANEPFDWKVFDKVILPLNDSERKPSPTLFARARALAGGCPMVFVGENQVEVKAARDLGLSAFQAGKKDRSFFLPRKLVSGHIQKTYAPRFLTECSSGK